MKAVKNLGFWAHVRDEKFVVNHFGVTSYLIKWEATYVATWKG